MRILDGLCGEYVLTERSGPLSYTQVREVSYNSISLLELILSAKHELRDYIRLQPNGPELLECLNQIEPYVKARNTHYTLSRGQPGSNKRKSSPNEVQPLTERKRARRRARTPKNGSATQGRPAKTCLECGRTETHQWRSGPQGMSTYVVSLRLVSLTCSSPAPSFAH